MSERVCLGAIAGPHGVRGLVRVKPFTEVPEGVASYGPVETEAGDRRLTLRITGAVKGQVIAAVEGVCDRDAALALKGEHLYVDRARLPDPQDGRFYHADLIGLSAVTLDGRALGRVTALHDFGAGEVVEIRDSDGRNVMLPFTETVVPEIDPAAGRLVVDPPAGALD